VEEKIIKLQQTKVDRVNALIKVDEVMPDLSSKTGLLGLLSDKVQETVILKNWLAVNAIPLSLNE